jgi:hypothetical protein
MGGQRSRWDYEAATAGNATGGPARRLPNISKIETQQAAPAKGTEEAIVANPNIVTNITLGGGGYLTDPGHTNFDPIQWQRDSSAGSAVYGKVHSELTAAGYTNVDDAVSGIKGKYTSMASSRMGELAKEYDTKLIHEARKKKYGSSYTSNPELGAAAYPTGAYVPFESELAELAEIKGRGHISSYTANPSGDVTGPKELVPEAVVVGTGTATVTPAASQNVMQPGATGTAGYTVAPTVAATPAPAATPPAAPAPSTSAEPPFAGGWGFDSKGNPMGVGSSSADMKAFNVAAANNNPTLWGKNLQMGGGQSATEPYLYTPADVAGIVGDTSNTSSTTAPAQDTDYNSVDNRTKRFKNKLGLLAAPIASTTTNPALEVSTGSNSANKLSELHELLQTKNVQLPVDQLSPESTPALTRQAISSSHQFLLQMGFNMKDSAGLSNHIARVRTGC